MITTIPDLLRSLRKHSQLIEGLFEKRERVVPIREAKGDEPLEVLQQLFDDGIIEIADENIALDDNLLTYFEYYFGAGDTIELLDYDNLLNDMDRHISTVVNSTNPNVTIKSKGSIRKILRKLPTNLLRNIAVIHRHIELAYKVAVDPEEKLAELEHYREKLKLLLVAEAKITTKLRSHRKGFFSEYAGLDLRLQYYRLHSALHDLRNTMMDLNNEVIEYINKLNQNSQFLKHILKLKDLKNRHEIKERTNLMALLSTEEDDLVLTTQKYDVTLLSRDFAESVDFIEIVEQLSVSKELPLPPKQRAGAIPKEMLDEEQVETTLDYEALYELFEKSGEDLLTYVTQYPYESEIDDEGRLLVFLQLATTYAEKLDFQPKGIEFAGYECMTIYPIGA